MVYLDHISSSEAASFAEQDRANAADGTSSSTVRWLKKRGDHSQNDGLLKATVCAWIAQKMTQSIECCVRLTSHCITCSDPLRLGQQRHLTANNLPENCGTWMRKST